MNAPRILHLGVARPWLRLAVVPHLRIALFGLLVVACTNGSPASDDASTEGGSETTETSGGADPTLPAELTAEAFSAFIAAEQYKGEGWQAETQAPREASSTSSPHGRVRVYLHETTIEAHSAGLGFVGGEPLPAGSAAVKEFYDDMDEHVGTALLYKHGDGQLMDATSYWCVGPQGRCSVTSPAYAEPTPLFGDGNLTACGGCHVGFIFTKLE